MKKLVYLLITVLAVISLSFTLFSCTEILTIEKTEINENGELILTYSDGTSANLGKVVGADGKDGAAGLDGKDGQDGKDGEKGADGEDGKDAVNENPQGLDFYPQSDGTYIVGAGLAKYLDEIVIPDTYCGSAVVGIAQDGFKSCTNLKNIVIGNSVTTIGSSAFYNCDSLTSVTIPDSVTSIGNRAFYNCTSLTSVNITDIAAWCNIEFSDYDSNPLCYAKNLYLNGELVTELTIPDGVTIIGYEAFHYCASLTSVTIGSGVTSIGSRAFYHCSSLTSIKYRGTEAEWNAISKGSFWDYDTGNYTITYNYTGE